MYKATMDLLKEINSHGYKAYVVGGYARDLYLNRQSLDVDICTNATPKELKDIFGDVMLPTIQYGSVTVIINKIRFEITTFRKEIKYENNRLPVKIKYINNLIDDLKRRDFYINTLCLDENGEFVDLLGACNDLDNKVIRMVGNPKKKLKEDSLRILRAIRFSTILDFKLDDELKKYIKKYGYLLKKLSYYRKKDELEKIFTSANAKEGINLLKSLDLVEPLELSNIESLVLTPSLIGIWAQLDVDEIYGFSNHEKDMIRQIKELSKLELNSYNLYKYGLYVASIVGEITNTPKKIITKKYNDLPIHSSKDIDIDIKSICNILNKEPGPFIKDIILDLEYKILNNQLKNTREHIEIYLKKNS